MTIVEGEYVVGNGFIMDMIYIASHDKLCVAGCRLVGPENEEYYLDRKGFMTLEIKTGLKIKTVGEYTYCTYSDGETEIFEITSEFKWYDRYWDIAEGNRYSDMWMDTFLRKKGTYILNEKEAKRLINKAVKSVTR